MESLERSAFHRQTYIKFITHLTEVQLALLKVWNLDPKDTQKHVRAEMVRLESARLGIPTCKPGMLNNDNISNSDTGISRFFLKSNVFNSIERATFLSYKHVLHSFWH